MTIQRKIVILHMVILTFSCKQNQVIVKYDNESRYEDIDKTMIADKSKESVTVFLESYFNGFVKGYIRDELIFNKKIKTEESLGTTSEYLFYDYSKDEKKPIINIESDDGIAEIEIKKEFKLIYVYKHNDKWEIIYSNVYPTYE